MKKICSLLFVLSILNCNSSFGQLWISAGGGDIKTGTSVANVIVVNNLGVKVTSLLLPASTGGSPSTIYNLTVNKDIALWDNTTDMERRIIGLSPMGGIGIYSGDNDQNGGAIRLNSMGGSGVTSGGYPAGSVQTFSYADGIANTLAFEHVNYNARIGGPQHIFRTYFDGSTQIGNFNYPTTLLDRLRVDGDLFINNRTTGTDPHDIDRNIKARGVTTKFNFTSGAAYDGSDGACLTANAWNIPTTGLMGDEPGAFTIKTFGMLPNHHEGFSYRAFNPDPMDRALHNLFLIDNQGNGIIGQDVGLGNMINGDVLTVKQALGFYAPSIFNMQINGNAPFASLQLNASTNYSDGAKLELYGASNAIGGQVKMYANGTSGPGTTFYNYDGYTPHANLLITNTGETAIGHNIAASDITSGDVLTVTDQIGFKASSANTRQINGNTTTAALVLNAKTASSNGPSIEMYGTACPGPGGDDRRGRIHYIGEGSAGYDHVFFNYHAANWTPEMAITTTGKVVIGSGLINLPTPTHTAGNYNLYVQNGILTEHVRVALVGSVEWPDYVFGNNYALPPLKKVASYIAENKHLPELPSASEVAKDGVDLGQMEAKLLQKIEELTLYVIQQQKEIDELKKATTNR